MKIKSTCWAVDSLLKELNRPLKIIFCLVVLLSVPGCDHVCPISVKNLSKKSIVVRVDEDEVYSAAIPPGAKMSVTSVWPTAPFTISYFDAATKSLLKTKHYEPEDSDKIFVKGEFAPQYPPG